MKGSRPPAGIDAATWGARIACSREQHINSSLQNRESCLTCACREPTLPGNSVFMVAGFWSLVSGSWFLVAGFWFLVAGFWSLVSGFWFVVCGLWFVVCGFWFVVSGLWFLVCGFWLGERSDFLWCLLKSEPRTRNQGRR